MRHRSNQPSDTSQSAINKACHIISSCNMIFEDCTRKENMKDSFYKHKKQWDAFTKIK